MTIYLEHECDEQPTEDEPLVTYDGEAGSWTARGGNVEVCPYCARRLPKVVDGGKVQLVSAATGRTA